MSTPICPKCTGRVERMRRTWLDHSIGKIVLVLRYGCVDEGCNWQGLVRVPDQYPRPFDVAPVLWTVASIALMVGVSFVVMAQPVERPSQAMTMRR